MDYISHILVLVLLYWALAGALNLITGYTGILSIAHAAFYGVGAYTAALMSLHFHTPFTVNILCAAVTCMVLGLMVGGPTLRLRRDDFVVGSFALQIIAFSIFNNWISLTGGPIGLPGIPPPTFIGYAITSRWAFVVLTGIFAAVVFGLLRIIVLAPFGRVLRAIREDEVFPAAMAKNVYVHKLLAFVVCAVIAGCAGVIYAHYMRYIDPSSFSFMESVFMISIVVLGGAGSLWGPLVGAAVLVVMPEVLRLIGLPDGVAANLRQCVYGAVLAACMLWRPQGLVGEYAFGREAKPK